MTTSPALLAVALVVVQELYTVRGAVVGAGVGQTLVDVTLAPGPGVARTTLAGEASDLVHTDSTIETCSDVAVVKILLTQRSFCSRRTGAFELSNEIDTSASIMTRVPSTLIDVNLALRTHETLWTLTTVSRHEVAAGCSIVARVGGAGVRFMLTVGAPVALDTVARV